MKIYILATLLLPLFGGLSSYLTKAARWTFLGTTAGITIALLPLIKLFVSNTSWQWRFDWLPDYQVGWQIDRISVVFSLLVLFIALMVSIFSITYMESDKDKRRYFGLLGFFAFSMLGLLFADHLLLLFVFWELVGFSSYLLIGFWYRDENKSFSSRYAFITNRIADAALLSGILWMGSIEGSLMITELSETTTSIVGLLLIFGAFGKSAQGPFFTWLPRAMAGPTPVSALIHAATMVAAGVYLLIRISPVLDEAAMLVLAIVGAITALLAAIAAMTQYDIKAVLAYSTISQLGYMVMAIGVGASSAAFFHLWTHAFFKAGLFLAAGSIIHYMHHIGHHEDAQDIRAMGGLKLTLKLTFFAFTVCTAALAGLPFFTGYFSKEAILLSTIDWSDKYSLGFMIPFLGLSTVVLTAYYMFRLWMYVFMGRYRGNHLTYQFKESTPVIMTLAMLAIGSVYIWYALNPFAHDIAFVRFLFGSVEADSSIIWLPIVSIGLALSGIAFSYIRYKGLLDQDQTIEVIREDFDRSRSGIKSISFKAFFLDDFYIKILNRGFVRLALMMHFIDKKIIDGFIDRLGVFMVLLSKTADLIDKLIVDGVVNFAARLSQMIGSFTRVFHANRVQLHFFWAVIVLILFILGKELF